MAVRDLFIPQGPINVAHRPLNKGMMRHLPTTLMPQGSVFTAKNLIIGTAGPLRRPGTGQVAGGASVLFSPVRSLILLTKTDGTQLLIAIDDKLMYVVGASALTLKSWDYDSGLVNVSAGALTVSGLSTTNWDGTYADLKAGDVIKMGTGATLERLVVQSIDASNLLTLESVTAYAHTATAYDIYRAFGASNPYLVTWAIASNKIVFADSYRPLYAFDGTSFGDYDSALTFIPSCVEFFKDRLWCGHIVNGANDLRQRIIWSTTTDLTDFDVTGRYQDLPYQQGAVQRLIGMGELLMAYFDDAIYFGRATNIAGDTLPVAFDRIESGGIGLVGMAAVTPFLDGHFFVGQDNIYFLSVKGFEPIGTPIVSESIESCENLWAVYASVDASHNRIVFGFPSESEEMTKLWSFNYKAKCWSYDELTCTAIAGLSRAESITWDAQSGYTWDSPSYDTWNQARRDAQKRFFIGQSGKIFELSDSATSDESNAAIAIELETPDFDDDLPNMVKTTTRLSIKIDRVLASNLVLNVSWSTDRGNSWNSAGACTITAGDDESFVGFLATGSTIRFKLTSSSLVGQYRIMEMVRRSRGRGLEIHLGPAD